jgi:hypothetical protein
MSSLPSSPSKGGVSDFEAGCCLHCIDPESAYLFNWDSVMVNVHCTIYDLMINLCTKVCSCAEPDMKGGLFVGGRTWPINT